MKRIAVAALLAVAACTPPTTAPTPVAPTAVHASFAKTWDAVIDELSQRTIPVKTLDRSSGFVVAEVATVPVSDLKTLTSDCGTFSAFMLKATGPGVANYNIVVRGDSTASTVRVTLAVTEGAARCATRGTFETAMQDEIKARAETK